MPVRVEVVLSRAEHVIDDDPQTVGRRQHGAPSFPVDFTALGATIEFVQLQPGIDHEIAGLTVRLLLQRHAGDSFGFRFTSAGRSVVYTTDSEHKLVEAAIAYEREKKEQDHLRLTQR